MIADVEVLHLIGDTAVRVSEFGGVPCEGIVANVLAILLLAVAVGGAVDGRVEGVYFREEVGFVAFVSFEGIDFLGAFQLAVLVV